MKLVFILLLLQSCGSTKQLSLMQDLPDSLKIKIPEIKTPAATIQVDDFIDIKIIGKYNETVADFNSKSGAYNVQTTGFVTHLVDKDGNIELYKIGKVQAVGLTKEELKAKLVRLLENEIVECNVFVKLSNFKFTILGEVKSPGNFNLPVEKITLLEALGYCGDFTQNAKKGTVRILRDSAGLREIGIINFSQKTLLTSEYYYLKRNDIIIVSGDFQQKRSAEALSKFSSYLGLATGLITLSVLLFKRN